jgi:hypothetical protein
MLSIGLVLLWSATLTACPMCRDSIGASGSAGAVAPGAGDTSLFAGAGGGISGGFNVSIYLMFFGFAACLGIVMYNIVRGVRATNEQNGSHLPPAPPAAR